MPHALPGAGAAAAQLEPEPEPEPQPDAVAEAVPVLPLARRTLATSNFKAAYGDAEVPKVLEIGGILTDLIRSYCTKEGIPWNEEGVPFLKQLQAEAMANAQELVDQIPWWRSGCGPPRCSSAAGSSASSSTRRCGRTYTSSPTRPQG